ncbi:MAG: hypothetical protein CMH83_18485 [Nocardioides sp.]|nr:hypothetical protein [Nocardioides sp.]
MASLGATAGLALAVIPGALATTSAQAAAAAPTAAPASSQDPWTATDEAPQGRRDGHRQRVAPSEYAAYTLDDAALGTLLDRAPLEGSAGAATELQVPAPSGDLVTFRIVESPIMEDGLAADHPEIATYAGRAVDSAATIRLDVTPMGFHASVRGDGASWYVDPAWNGDDSLYLSYLGEDLPDAEKHLVEPELDELDGTHSAAPRAGETEQGAPVIHRTYRLALITDQSYARYFGTENVIFEKVTLMNRVNQIYNDDLAIRLDLVDGTDQLNFATDELAYGADGPCGPTGCFAPNQFANGCSGSLLNRNLFAASQVIGAENYDIGHVMLGINGGGVAGLGVVGGNGKARGCTGLPQPEGDFMAIDYVAHEMGHQFGGNHTFNGNQLNCGGNKAAPAVEPGSGSSVMAYAGICRQDDLQPHTDPYFSQWSQQEMTAYIVSSPTVNEVQTVQLVGFDTDGESFTVSYDGATSAPITRGVNYTTTGIRTAITAVLPAGGSVSVSALGGSGALNDTGFQLTFSGSTNPLAGTDLDLVTVESTDITSVVSETTKGAMRTNGGVEAVETANHTPVVTAPAEVSIPLRTPFALTGEATDADGDEMVYLWEQTDRGVGSGTSLVSQTKTNGPLFRVFGTFADVTPAGTLQYHSPGENIADGNPTRTFPDMEQILVNNTNAATGLCPDAPAPPTSGPSNVPVPTRDCFSEWLPTIDYVGSPQAGNDVPLSLNFRFTARDLDPTAGGYAFANTRVLVDNTAGPFLVSSKNVAAAAIAGRTEVVSWAVAGTDKPELAENVRITLSTDGGRTFPIVLAESTPNDGSHPVTWPNVATTEARIKVEAVGNVFFDVNDADFEIVADEAPETELVSGTEDGAIVTSGSVSYELASSENRSTFVCSLNGTPVDCEDGTVTLTDLPSGTHVFRGAAVDTIGQADPTPVVRTFTVPFNDTRFGVRNFERLTSPSAYDGTFSLARAKNAVLRGKIAGARSVALVVGGNARSGSVTVYLDDEEIGTVDLATSSPTQRVVAPVASFDSARSGVLRVVTDSKKIVRIEGVAVVRR